MFCNMLLIGGAVDLFYRYGFFSLSVRVVPRDDPGKWLIREPTARIFDNPVEVENRGPDTIANQPIQVCESNHFHRKKMGAFRLLNREP